MWALKGTLLSESHDCSITSSSSHGGARTSQTFPETTDLLKFFEKLKHTKELHINAIGIQFLGGS